MKMLNFEFNLSKNSLNLLKIVFKNLHNQQINQILNES